MTKLDLLQEGAEILSPILTPHGFSFRITDSGRSSGGEFAAGEFKRKRWAFGKRWALELHCRYSLGLVSYHFDTLTLSHENYLWSVTGRRGAGEYPGFSDEPLDAFRRLDRDIQTYCSAFVSGDQAEFERLVEVTVARKKQLDSVSGFRKLSV